MESFFFCDRYMVVIRRKVAFVKLYAYLCSSLHRKKGKNNNEGQAIQAYEKLSKQMRTFRALTEPQKERQGT